MRTFIPVRHRSLDAPPAETLPAPRTARRWRGALIALGVLAVLFGAYTAGGFLGVPYLLRTNLQSFVRTHYKRTLNVGEIHFNPFTFVLTASGVSLPDANGRPMASFERLRVVPSIATLWRLAPSFREITLQRPVVHAVVRRNGRLNLEDLAAGLAGKPAAAQPPQAPMKLFIERLQVIDGSGEWVDRTRPGPFRQALHPVSFELRDFSTRGGTGNRYELTAASPRGMHLKWNGTLALAPLASKGSFEVTGLPVKTLWSYLRSPLPIASPPGAVAVHGQYDATETPRGLGLKARVPDLILTGLKLRPAQGEADYVDLPRIELKNTRLDLAGRSLEVGQVISTGGTVSAWRKADGKVNLLELMSSRGQAASSPKPAAATHPHTTAGSSAGASGTSGWHLSVPDIEVKQLKVAAEDREVKPAPAFTLQPVDVRVAGYRSAPGARLTITLDSTVNGTGKLEATAQLSPGSQEAIAQVNAQGLDLAVLQPYVAQQTGMTLLSGKLSSRMKVARQADGAVAATGTVRVADLRTVDDEAKQDFIRWKDLRISDIRYRSRPARLAIGNIIARAPYARVIIFPNLTTNIQEILTPRSRLRKTAVGPSAGGISAQPVASTEAGAPGARTDRTSSKGPNRTETVATARRVPLTPIPVTIRNVQIIDGSANYADFWIQPNFRVGIQTLNGSVSGLSSDPSSRADVKLDGKVDRYAPAQISGKVNLLSATTYSDIKLSFKGLEMTTVTPYSGRFAGYKIDKGKLSVDLSYKVENRQLTAQQHFVIDQLQLGQRVQSKDAVKLPLRLAVALLKDRNGVIDIGLPMKGNLDDPQFSLGPLIWKAFVNLLGKIVTAPFAALGHLFGGGEKMNIINFAPGSAVIDAQAKQRLDSVIKAMNQRPQLKLDVPAAFDPQLDRQGLARALLHEQLALAAQGRKRAEDTGPVDESVLADPQKHFRLALAAYRSEMKGAPLPASVQAAQKAHARDAATLQPAIHDLEDPLVARTQVPDTDLQQLGTQRAQAVQDALVAGGVAGARVFIVNEEHKGNQGHAAAAGETAASEQPPTNETPSQSPPAAKPPTGQPAAAQAGGQQTGGGTAGGTASGNQAGEKGLKVASAQGEMVKLTMSLK